MRFWQDHGVNIALALAAGLALRFGFGLQPLWWLAWLAPAPLLVAALRSPARAAWGLAFLAGLVAASGSFHFMTKAMPLPLAVWVTVLQALLWVLVVGLARRVMLRFASAWSVLAYPVLWCAVDTLLAHPHPDGNWGSLAYSQAGFLPAVQVVSLFGTAGLVFVLSLVPAAIALAVVRGWRAVRVPGLCALALAAATFGFGYARMPVLVKPGGDTVGLAVIDDFIGPRVPRAQVERIWAQYERHVEALAAQGARIVLLPEKIAVLSPADAAQVEHRMAALAARTKVWLALGIGIDDGREKQNLAWLLAPDGRRDASYQKHHMAPPEREFAPGSGYDLRDIGGARYGLAICKDMHFAAMGRAYGTRQAGVMLVPAWDFGIDAWYAARLSALRGVESGFAMVRAAREGLLTVSDAHGRILAEAPSAGLPGTTLLATVPATAPLPTLYSRIGDLFGWLCTGAALLMLLSLARLRTGLHAAAPLARSE